ncbi:hypothetical protein BH23CYA1_BH23CYA1_04560 [soil metagenome]|uniref:hypothetical protein n=1 Tax=Leptolyngbya sp. BC1307 TaxID=2029589 RepID=UPI000EFC5BF0|nr:hypothetical protein [Leptolyngbya sp. BC1307]
MTKAQRGHRLQRFLTKRKLCLQSVKIKTGTAIVYFGATQQAYLDLINAGDHHQAYIAYIQAPLRAQISREQHQRDCTDMTCYTVHSHRRWRWRGWGGEIAVLPMASGEVPVL